MDLVLIWFVSLGFGLSLDQVSLSLGLGYTNDSHGHGLDMKRHVFVLDLVLQSVDLIASLIFSVEDSLKFCSLSAEQIASQRYCSVKGFELVGSLQRCRNTILTGMNPTFKDIQYQILII